MIGDTMESIGRSLARSRFRVAGLLVAAALGVSAVIASSASAACYFVNGGCGWGSMGINSPTAWTGNYYTGSDWMSMFGDEPFNYLTIQIRTTPTSGVYTKTVFGTTNVYPHVAGNFQHRCYQGGPQTARVFKCGFD